MFRLFLSPLQRTKLQVPTSGLLTFGRTSTAAATHSVSPFSTSSRPLSPPTASPPSPSQTPVHPSEDVSPQTPHTNQKESSGSLPKWVLVGVACVLLIMAVKKGFAGEEKKKSNEEHSANKRASTSASSPSGTAVSKLDKDADEKAKLKQRHEDNKGNLPSKTASSPSNATGPDSLVSTGKAAEAVQRTNTSTSNKPLSDDVSHQAEGEQDSSGHKKPKNMAHHTDQSAAEKIKPIRDEADIAKHPTLGVKPAMPTFNQNKDLKDSYKG